jgi:YHS domain-containing protein
MIRSTIFAMPLGAMAVLGCAGAPLAHAQPSGQHAMSQHSSETAVEPFTLTLGMSGYSPVSYIEHNRAEPGSPRYTAEYDGVTYFFTSDAQRRTFERSPSRFLPAYGGYCAFGCSVDSKFIPDPTSFEVINGRTHLFLKNAEVDAKKLWHDADPAKVRAEADEFWASQSKSKAYINGRNVPASGIGLDGYSPVSYFTAGGPEKGDPAFAVEHNGVTYHLTSAAQVEMFKANPAKYEPQCGGWCAFGMTVEDKFPVDPTKYRVIDDRLYLFLNNDQVNAHDLWGQGEQQELLGKAHAHWKTVSGQ